MAKAKTKAQTTKCINNLKQLTLGWVMYSNDNEDKLLPNDSFGGVNVWIVGKINSAAAAVNLHYIRTGSLFPFNPATGIYVCPADKPRTIGGTLNVQAVRSYSLNLQMNGTASGASHYPNPAYTASRKMSDINRPGPAVQFAFVDEEERAIMVRFLGFDMNSIGKQDETPV